MPWLFYSNFHCLRVCSSCVWKCLNKVHKHLFVFFPSSLDLQQYHAKLRTTRELHSSLFSINQINSQSGTYTILVLICCYSLIHCKHSYFYFTVSRHVMSIVVNKLYILNCTFCSVYAKSEMGTLDVCGSQFLRECTLVDSVCIILLVLAPLSTDQVTVDSQ